MIGAKKVSGLFFKGCVTKVITVTTRIIYAEALRALIMGFLDIYWLYQNLLPLADDVGNYFLNKLVMNLLYAITEKSCMSEEWIVTKTFYIIVPSGSILSEWLVPCSVSIYLWHRLNFFSQYIFFHLELISPFFSNFLKGQVVNHLHLILITLII